MHLYLSIFSKPLRITAIISASLLLTHCASNPTISQSPVEVRDIESNRVEVEALETFADIYTEDIATPYVDDNNINVERAEHYQQLANRQSAPTDQTNATLSSAEYYIQAGDYIQAERAADSLNTSFLTPSQLNRRAIIKAYVDYSRGLFDSALLRLQDLLTTSQEADSEQIISNASSNASENQTQKVDALLLSSFCYQQLNDYDAAISALIEREALLSGNARAETSRYTWQVINSLSRESRVFLLEQTENVLVRNRLEQSLDGQFANTAALPTQFDQWRGTTTDQQQQTVASDWTINSPKKIAILLPLTSRFTKAAHAVMDGIEYTHNTNTSPYKPTIDFFDIGENPFQASQYYSSISQMGFDLVIGPIGKDYANQLISSGSNSSLQSVPTILLGGDIDLASQYNRAFSRLTLSPEAEGLEVARYAQTQGHVSAAILEPTTETGRRTSLAFQQRWLGLGGNISKVISYSPTQYDHSVELKQLFDINQSQSRYNKISNVLGFKPEFSAYRRTDVDFIFMIADNDTGRIVHPQINFFSGKTVPVYSTSAVFNGIQDEVNNLDLEDALFPVMPWILQSMDIAPYAGQLNMLFALGSDAYQLAANYQALRNNSTLSVNGNMGSLHIEESGEIVYQPVWAQFKNGLAEATTELAPLEGNNLLLNNSPQRTQSQPNSYDDSNWDTGRSSRKTGASVP